MALRIVRNDITKMDTEAIVNTAGATTEVGDGCDVAVYMAAGYDELHKLREEIGYVPEGEVFITPGFALPAKYIIHAVSPAYIDGNSGEEEKLRSCYRNSLKIAKEKGIKSIAFPLISTGAYGYPKEEGMRIAIDEINAFLMRHSMDITLVVFDTRSV
ncbi:MAG: macro domain-containing protein, partial [Lachnospiraceae bacterium]|nr:macro domain-containing protein [Lachnospiraceae bacterium]